MQTLGSSCVESFWEGGGGSLKVDSICICMLRTKKFTRGFPVNLVGNLRRGI